LVLVYSIILTGYSLGSARLRRSQMPAKFNVVIYSRPGCHLCDEAKQIIAAAGHVDEYTLDEINIESNPELFKRYQHDIPVITIDGIETFKHRLTVEQFQSAIARHL
jgi:glutaredoxin